MRRIGTQLSLRLSGTTSGQDRSRHLEPRTSSWGGPSGPSRRMAV